MAVRMEEVESGVAFLKHPNVQVAPLSQRLAFLEEKGLTAAEVSSLSLSNKLGGVQ